MAMSDTRKAVCPGCGIERDLIPRLQFGSKKPEVDEKSVCSKCMANGVDLRKRAVDDKK